jgi:hypothetical protein
MPPDSFAAWFSKATGHTPFPYQIEFGTAGELPHLFEVSSGG